MKEQKTKSVQQNMLFNTAGSVIYYFCVWLASIVIVRLSGFSDAGIFSVAMTATASPAIIGLFNVRSYQVSDLTGQYSDRTYIQSRIVTNALSFAVCSGLVMFYGYDLYKAAVVLVYMGYKLVEGAADVYYGIDQKKERLDYAGISLTIRGIGSLTGFIVGFLISGSLLISVIAMLLVSLVIVVFYDRRVSRSLMDQPKEGQRTGLDAVKSLIITCFPLAVVAFLNNLSLTVPRIYLEKFYGEEVMGYYASVSSPTLVIQLAAMTLFAPLVPILTQKFLEKNKKEFLGIIWKFTALMGALTILALVLSKFFAEWALVLIFKEEIRPYVYLFIPVMLSAVLIAVNASLFSICTLMRIIRPQYAIGIAGFLTAVLMSFTVVKTMSMDGVIIALFAALLIQIAIQIALIVVGIKKRM